MGLPQVTEDKKDKIIALFVQKILPSKGLDSTFVNMELEFPEEAEMSTGNAIVEFTSPEAARNAQNKLDGFDKIPKVVLTAVTFD